MADPRPLTRQELALFLPNLRAIRAFEKLFDLIPDDLIELLRLTEEAATTAATAMSVAQQAANARSRSFDYLDLTGNPARVGLPRRLSWSRDNDTVDIFHEDGTVQQVGEEQYIRFHNGTGSVIANGTVLGLDFVDGVIVGNVIPYIADGTLPALNILGIATSDIEPGTTGRLTSFGNVRDFDTTGTPYGEVWSAGQALYASDTMAGGLTNVKPTSPSWAIPLALVGNIGITEGDIFVRVTVEQSLYYGAFAKTVSQVPTAIDTAYPITFDVSYETNGVELGDPPLDSRIYVNFSGLYSFNASFQLTSTNSSSKDIRTWFRVNGVDRDFSTIIVTLSGNNQTTTQTRSLFLLLNAGDYVEMAWASTNTAVELTASPGNTYSPSAPASVVTVEQIHQ